jgi:hypothetical protein
LQGEAGWAQAIVIMLSADDEAKLKDQFVSTHERSTEGKLRVDNVQNLSHFQDWRLLLE